MPNMPVGQCAQREPTQRVIEEIADIIRRVSKREDVENEVAENINFSQLIVDLMKKEGPLRNEAARVIIKFFKDYTIETDSEEAATIIEGMDFKSIVGQFSSNKGLQDALIGSIKTVLENAGDSDEFTETVDEAFGLADAKKMAKLLGNIDNQELQGVLVKAIKAYLENFDIDNLSEDIQQEIEAAIFTKERIQACFASQAEDIDVAIMRVVKDFVQGVDITDSDDPLIKLITESKALGDAVEAAIATLVKTGKINKLVEDVATSMLTGKDSDLRSKLTTAISERLVGKIAGSITDRLFTGSR